MASWGVPAHLSIVYPFVPPADVDDEVLTSLAAAVGTVSAFDCAFRGTDWFGDDVVWLLPDPDAPFRELVRAVVASFPAYRPYGAVYDDVVPHLTIGELRLGSADELAPAERAVRSHLPIRARVDGAVLLAGGPNAPPGSPSRNSVSAPRLSRPAHDHRWPARPGRSAGSNQQC
jgi:2'-5' RNA ligase